LKCDGTRAETIFHLSAKRTSPSKSARTSFKSTTISRGVRISGSKAGYTMFRGSVKSTGYPLHSSVSPSLPLPCITVCHHFSTGLYLECEVLLREGSLSYPVVRQLNYEWFIAVPCVSSSDKHTNYALKEIRLLLGIWQFLTDVFKFIRPVKRASSRESLCVSPLSL